MIYESSLRIDESLSKFKHEENNKTKKKLKKYCLAKNIYIQNRSNSHKTIFVICLFDILCSSMTNISIINEKLHGQSFINILSPTYLWMFRHYDVRTTINKSNTRKRIFIDVTGLTCLTLIFSFVSFENKQKHIQKISVSMNNKWT